VEREVEEVEEVKEVEDGCGRALLAVRPTFRGRYPLPPANCIRVRKRLKTKGTKMGKGALGDKKRGAGDGE